MSIHIKEIAFVYHPVADIARAREFYGKVLGLKTGLEIEFGGGAWWIEYDVAGIALAVSNAGPPATGGGATLALEVASIDDALAAIAAAKVPVTLEVQEFPPCRMFIIGSPDGHAIMLHQRKAAHPAPAA